MTIGATLRLASIALASTMAAASSWAVPMAHAQLDLSTLKVSFTDNDAADGINASVELLWSASYSETCVTADGDGTCAWGGGGGQFQWVDNLVDPVATSDSAPGLSGSATIQAGAGLLDATMVGVSPAGERSANAERYGVITSHGAGHLHFSIDYSLFADAGGAPSFQDALAWTGIVVSPDLDYWGKHFQFDALLHRPATGFASSTGTITGDFDLDDGRQYLLEARVHADVDNIPAVPEPETWALMLAGLGALGLAARRRA
ncbi:PEPxxWA-CTERM sorting domain-containing protein [Piscinibacter terrae]|uniref:PEPxxWA-CTERM sorting domain-containing protein n=1 Tax=Piscinibacter terrae TaxID=2496871 RepID=UPI001F3BF857|nr:PEPxxWA-CTERM sorting domain-containing protein [Albitalea terrae]